MAIRLRGAERHARTEREVLREQLDEELRAHVLAAQVAAEEQARHREAQAAQRGAHEVLERLAGQGVVFVVAGGNENTDACSRSPASTPAAAPSSR